MQSSCPLSLVEWQKGMKRADNMRMKYPCPRPSSGSVSNPKSSPTPRPPTACPASLTKWQMNKRFAEMRGQTYDCRKPTATATVDGKSSSSLAAPRAPAPSVRSSKRADMVERSSWWAKTATPQMDNGHGSAPLHGHSSIRTYTRMEDKGLTQSSSMDTVTTLPFAGSASNSSNVW